ncbi:DUF222 domain-containing protein [Tessaracoccus oleiagri]|uniref:DUF222 domain-containing protein n=1 Tax=Tessaracoccus oleiagri TaxID=686624 RepID=A0A1G9JFH6_9ACTN|nr:DUF222 domain-containing protein [Tessaracoccus oleiagri]SDL35864.1 protein of unknown function [Tessaracoccus oleiagri]
MFEMVPMTSADAFAAVAHAHEHRRAAEVAEKIALLRAAELYKVDQNAIWAVTEQEIQAGSDGTPLVGEFLAHELAGLLGVSPESALWQVGQVLDLRHRHPALWEAFLAGTVWFWQAAKIVQACSDLSAEAVAVIDRRTAHALQLWPWTRIMHHLPAWIIDADPTHAATKAANARQSRGMHIGKIEDGHCTLNGRLAAEDGIALDEALDSIAATLPAPELPEWLEDATDGHKATYRRDQRRATAAGILARQTFGQHALPVELIVHVDANDLTHGTGAARIERWGTILTDYLPEFLNGSAVTVRPVLDPATLSALDGYEPSAAMRLALQVRNPVDVFPYGTRPARGCDLDHTEPYRFDGNTRGQTGMHNLGPLSRRSHRAKTHGGWRLTQPEPGVFHWRSPAGYEYLVTATGTIRIGALPRDPWWLRSDDDPPRWLRSDEGAPRSPDEPDRSPDPPPDHPAWDKPLQPELIAWAIAQHTLTNAAA